MARFQLISNDLSIANGKPVPSFPIFSSVRRFKCKFEEHAPISRVLACGRAEQLLSRKFTVFCLWARFYGGHDLALLRNNAIVSADNIMARKWYELLVIGRYYQFITP